MKRQGSPIQEKCKLVRLSERQEATDAASEEATDICGHCKRHWMNIQTVEKIKLCVCLDVCDINYAGSKEQSKDRKRIKEMRTKKNQEILKKISALRNSGGGSLVVHMRGIEVENRCLCFFSELTDNSLNELIEDGRQFVEVYKKTWLTGNSNDGLTEYFIITVTGSSSITTADFNTKVALDTSIIRPSPQSLYSFLKSDVHFKDTTPQIRGLEDTPFEESRNIEFKSTDKLPSFDKSDVPGKVDLIWNNLRLRECITSISKIEGGGSVYIGITEKNASVGKPSYLTVKTENSGLFLAQENHQEFKSCLFEKIQKNIFHFKGQESRKIEDICRIELHPLKERNKFVAEVAVGAASGCLFYDINGPETYRVVNREMMRVPFDTWCEKFMKTHQ